MYIKVRVYPDAKRENFNKISETQYEISVREKAERNIANRRVIEIIKENLNLTKVKIVSGHQSVSKIFDIEK